MATSGTTAWHLNIAEIIETAARRARGAAAGALSAQDARNARNCLNMVLTDITNAGYALSQLEFKTLALTLGTQSYTLPTDVLDIFDVVYARYNGAGQSPEWTETALTRIDLAAYNRINDKTMKSYVSQFALDRKINHVTAYIFPTCENSVDELRYWAMTRMQDATAAYQDVGLAYRYTNTLIAGVAYYMYMEQDTIEEQKLARLKVGYEEALDLAFGEDRDRSSVFITPALRGR